jgi:hypothetical protein
VSLSDQTPMTVSCLLPALVRTRHAHVLRLHRQASSQRVCCPSVVCGGGVAVLLVMVLVSGGVSWHSWGPAASLDRVQRTTSSRCRSRSSQQPGAADEPGWARPQPTAVLSPSGFAHSNVTAVGRTQAEVCRDRMLDRMLAMLAMPTTRRVDRARAMYMLCVMCSRKCSICVRPLEFQLLLERSCRGSLQVAMRTPPPGCVVYLLVHSV